MTRQVALGAIVAFTVTVLALSVCQPSTATVATQPQQELPTAKTPPPELVRPAPMQRMLKPNVMVARPELLQGRVQNVAPIEVADAGSP